ncbi:DUF397 domain-containing protein [Saccharomonospora sp.]|uniref:DUF397 domain-containing protein n=1 Tax=Saccharomonospora sp. TaxID=33913 RepID=UPI00262AC16C|nr:DUF397 domain-containing protein [Saccharomonospora sp.]
MRNDPRDIDDKFLVRDELDLSSVSWHRLPGSPRDDRAGSALEYAFVTHSDTTTYAVLRQGAGSDGAVLVFTPSEWDAFLLGVRDGEFDRRN